MLPPYTTASSPPVESNCFEDASTGLFTQLYCIVLCSWQTAWATFKLIYPFLTVCLACYQVYNLCAIFSVTRRATKATEKLMERYSEYKSAQEGLGGLCDNLSDIIDSVTSGNEATLEAIRRAMESGTSVPPPDVAELLKKLEETQEVAMECTARVGRAVCRVTKSLCEGTARAFEEYQAADDRLVEVTSGCLRYRRKSSGEKDEEKGEGK